MKTLVSHVRDGKRNLRRSSVASLQSLEYKSPVLCITSTILITASHSFTSLFQPLLIFSNSFFLFILSFTTFSYYITRLNCLFFLKLYKNLRQDEVLHCFLCPVGLRFCSCCIRSPWKHRYDFSLVFKVSSDITQLLVCRKAPLSLSAETPVCKPEPRRSPTPTTLR